MRVLSLFSGIGAHDLGLEWAGFTIAGQVEIDDYCQEILQKHWPKVPKWRDITTVTATNIRRKCGKIDLITGGFPCQDISCAGKQKGISEGERSSLWWEMWRLIRQLRPDWLLLENVPALRTNGADNVLASLEAIGYSCWPLVVGAWHAGAPHKRNRVWIVAYSKHSGGKDASSQIQSRENLERQFISGSESISGVRTTFAMSRAVGVGDSPRHKGEGRFRERGWTKPAWSDIVQHEWEYPRTTQLPLGRSVYGDSGRLALKAIGNANPPIMAYFMGKAIMKCLICLYPNEPLPHEQQGPSKAGLI